MKVHLIFLTLILKISQINLLIDRNLPYHRVSNPDFEKIAQSRFSKTSKIAQKTEKLKKKIAKNPKNSNRKLHKQKKKTLNNNDKGPICQSAVLSFFNIRSSQDLLPIKATEHELNLCSKNTKTCCGFKEISSISHTFKQGARLFQRNMEYIEELLTLFKGSAFSRLINRHKGDESCINQQNEQTNNSAEEILEPITGKKTNDELYNNPLRDLLKNDNFREWYPIIEQLLEDLTSFSTTQVYYYANLVCTICDPRQNVSFKLDHFELKFSPESCNQIIRNDLFEVSFSEFLRDFLYPLVNYIGCVEQRTDKISLTTGLHLKIDLGEFNERKDRLRGCLFKTAGVTCESLCKKSLKTFSFNYFQIGDVKTSLKFLFRMIHNSDIEDYYVKIKGIEFDVDFENEDEIVFYESANISYSEKIMLDLKLQLDYEGINPFFSQINKDFWKK